jgi:SAM-dependent methyltransferase
MNLKEDFTGRSKLTDIGRWYVTRVVKGIATSLPKDTQVLDAGAGECAYKAFFSHCDYKAIDLAVGESNWNYSNLDYVGPLHQMPIADGVFDIVLCTQVLEHLEWPRESVKEMYRVLKSRGKLLITVPMAHAEHQTPFDFFRYTSYGLKSLCSRAGFDQIDVQPLGGFFVRWAYELPRALSILPSAGLRSGNPNIVGIVLIPLKLLLLVVVRMVQILFLCLDPLDRAKNFPFGWFCTATKP